MESKLDKSLNKWMGTLMVAVVIISLAAWYFTRDTLPRSATLATAEKGGVFYEFGQNLAESYAHSNGHKLNVLATAGSAANRDLLLTHKADAALIQGGTVSRDGLSIIAPLYPEFVHIVVRANSHIETMEQLAGHTVILGKEGSGMRHSALAVLRHYGLEQKIQDAHEHYFLDLLTDETLDAAIVTTGILNQDLVKLAESGKFRLIPIRSAAAIEAKEPFLHRVLIPRGLYHESPAFPVEEVETVSAYAMLAARHDVSPTFVNSLLSAMYERGMAQEFPNLVPYSKVMDATPMPLNPEARRYFNPPDQIGFMANLLESLAAIKELMVAMGAAGFLLWDRWRKLKEKERETILKAQKEHLDSFLKKTLAIEEAQLNTTSPEALKKFLDEITQIKLTALNELTNEELRSDQNFLVFLMQCANLINKIQFKISLHSARPLPDVTEV